MRSRANHSTSQAPGSFGSVPARPGTSVPKHVMASLRFQRNMLAILCLLLAAWIMLFSDGPKLKSLRGPSECYFYFGPYRGPLYDSPESGTVGKPKCLVESKWLKLSQHVVQFPGTKSIMDDWMWIDYHDRINVLVEAKKQHLDDERRFLVFDQSKYALEGRTSKAIIGGIIEPGESAEDAARREVDEEMNGIQCKMFHKLGRYRTDVNRGMGWVNSFLAIDCDHASSKSAYHIALADEVGGADTERQDLKTISLTQLRDLARNGEFLEVQWAATVALALLHPDLNEA